jgi:hypothetical protein
MSELTRREVGKWVAAAAGVAVAGVAAGQQPPKVPLDPPAAAAPDATRVADPLGAMLADARTAYAKVRDYTCTFTRQERINDVLGAEQVAEMKVRAQPAAALVRFAKPEAAFGLEMLYAANKRDGKIRYRPGGLKAATTVVAADDPKLLAENRHPVTQLGVGPTLDLLGSIAAREKAMGNPVEVYASDYKFAGAAVTRYEVYTRRPHAHRYAYKVTVYVDKETKLPVRFEAYDQPKSGSAAGDLLEAYSYTNLKLNAGLGDATFE